MSSRISVGVPTIGGGRGGASPAPVQLTMGRIWYGPILAGAGANALRGIGYNPSLMQEAEQEWKIEDYETQDWEKGLGVIRLSRPTEQYVIGINDIARSICPTDLPVNTHVIVRLNEAVQLAVKNTNPQVFITVYPVRLM